MVLGDLVSLRHRDRSGGPLRHCGGRKRWSDRLRFRLMDRKFPGYIRQLLEVCGATRPEGIVIITLCSSSTYSCRPGILLSRIGKESCGAIA